MDIGVEIAKVEAPNPTRITVTVSGNTVSLVGEEGALPDNASCTEVFTYDTSLALQQTAAYRSGGRFDEIVFTYEGESSITTSIIVACFDGTSIGSPVFLQIEEGLFVWVLTNGAVSDGALSVYGNTVYLVSETTASASISRSDHHERDSDCTGVESTLYSLAIGGNYEEVASGCFAIDRVLALRTRTFVLSGEDFYLVSDGEFVRSCYLDLASGETIGKIAAAQEVDSDLSMIEVATNRAAYYCQVNSSNENTATPFGATFTLSSGWELTALTVSDNTTSGMGFNIGYSVIDTSTGRLVSPSGGSVASIDSFGAVQQSIVGSTATGVTPSLSVSALTFTEGLSTTLYSGIAGTTTAASGAAGSSSMTALGVNSALTTKSYLLDAALTIQTGSATTGDTLLDVSRTRTLIDYEIHPSGYALFFCAEDSSGNGQIYAYCPALLGTKSTPDGSELIQLTEGGEHCNEAKNWSIDQESSTGSVVIIYLSDPDLPQIRFIDPYTDPLLDGCF